MFSEEMNVQNEMRGAITTSSCDYVKHKIESLSQNKRVIQYSQLDP